MTIATVIIIAVLLAVAGWRTFWASDPEPAGKVRSPLIGGLITILFALLALLALLFPHVYAGKFFGFLPLLVLAAVYYAALYGSVPLLRKRFRATGIAALWLVPCILPYNFVSGMTRNRPLFWIRLGPAAAGIVRIVLIAYGIVALALFLRAVIAHVRYRSDVLKGVCSLTGTEARAVLEEEANAIGAFEKGIPDAMISPAVDVPLAIGFTRKSTVILLPRAGYTPDELRLIFRHELIHIARGDCMAKLDLAFVSAVFWPVPLIRKTAERCAEDLELSCDEIVLRNATEAERRLYARLILSRPAESEGFSTCLSAGAESLKYRLKQVTEPAEKRPGALLVCAALLVMILLFRTVGLSVPGGTGRDLIYEKLPGGTGIRWGVAFTESSGGFVDLTDDRFNDYIAGLELDHASWDYLPKDSPGKEAARALYLLYSRPDAEIKMTVIGDRIVVTGAGAAGSYRVPGGIDWNRIDSLISRPQ
jgi:beta-lactamase regulating signal transducer with metallopeptidase domain